MTARLVEAWGGPAGVTAILEEVEALGAAIGTRAVLAAAEAARLRGLADGGVGGVGETASTAARAEAALAALAAAACGPSGAVAAAGELAGDLGTAVRNYRQAEAEAASRMRSIDSVAGFAAGCAAPGIALLAAAAGGILGTGPGGTGALPSWARTLSRAALGAVEQHPELAAHLVNAVPGALAGAVACRTPLGLPALGALATAPVPAAPVAAAGVARLYSRGQFEVHDLPPPVPIARPSSLADLARLLLPDGAPGSGDGIDVHEVPVRLPDGRLQVVYLVVIPGTDDWSPPFAARTDSARDLASNLQLVAGERTELTRALPSLLDRMGVPRGADVVLVGHSQGGMVALQAAGDADLRGRVRIGGVVTFGSPLGTIANPGDIDVISLENVRDVVPHADGQPRNEDRTHHLTVRFDLGPAPAGAGPAYHHDMAAYLRGAKLVDAEAAAGHLLMTAALSRMLGRFDGDRSDRSGRSDRGVRDDRQAAATGGRSRRFGVRLDHDRRDAGPVAPVPATAAR